MSTSVDIDGFDRPKGAASLALALNNQEHVFVLRRFDTLHRCVN